MFRRVQSSVLGAVPQTRGGLKRQECRLVVRALDAGCGTYTSIPETRERREATGILSDLALADPRQKMEADMATWTIMVYFAGDTGLGQEMIWALKAIRETERPKGIKVVALFDGGGPPTTFTDAD